jgi:hypothetical protein
MIVSFVILCWNSEKYIEKCLDSIIAVNNITRHIIVIDNGSTDNTKAIINKFISVGADKELLTFEFLKLDKNYGTTYSRNVGIKHIQKHYPETDFFCILDSDTVINQGAMTELIKALENDEKCGIVGPRLHNSDGTYQVSGRNIPTLTEKIYKVFPIKSIQRKGEQMQICIDMNNPKTQEVGYLMSACWLVKREVVEKIGLLDEKIFYAPEDVEYCVRCWKAGYSIKYCAEADIIHEWQRLSRKKLFSKHNLEHIKGLLYFYNKHGYAFKQYKPY